MDGPREGFGFYPEFKDVMGRLKGMCVGQVAV